ncbi:LysR family transcriptional regulator [Neisseria meningitidis]|uniref:LysR family transcriptional regulator n=1 Tax=Neisseria meningitidis TaxID=487 RepID=UPI0021F1C94C|nr:LysR family transcriptional regulator [Neisseria meningitidis]MCV6706596.1 LysR family transcriptional regulator [Neisseria meningitidis]
MDAVQLKSFVAVAHEGNLTQAAKRLFLSQPAVSAQIKALEEYVGTLLFRRTGKGMVLTRAGEILLPEAESLLQYKHKLEHFAKTLAGDYSEETSLGIIHPIDSAKLVALTDNIGQTAPKTRLHIQYGMSGEILSRIQHKTLHGGFILGNAAQRGIRSVFLQNLTYALICPQSQYPHLTRSLPQSLQECVWIEMSGVSGSRKHLHQFWRSNRLSPKKQILCDYPQTIIDLVAGGIGVAMVPGNKAEAAAKEGAGVAIIESCRHSMPLNFIYAEEYEDNPHVSLLLECIEKVWGVQAVQPPVVSDN